MDGVWKLGVCDEGFRNLPEPLLQLIAHVSHILNLFSACATENLSSPGILSRVLSLYMVSEPPFE